MTENKDHVLYGIDPQILSQFSAEDHYIEVWRGLPRLHFEETRTRDGLPALKYGGRDGIWVIGEAVDVIKRNPHSLLVAFLQRDRTGTQAYRVSTPEEAFGDTLPDSSWRSVVERATQFNKETLDVVLRRGGQR